MTVDPLVRQVRNEDTTYKKRQHTKTTIDILLDNNKQAITFTSGLLEAKQIIKKYPSSEVAIVELVSKIYQKSEHEIEDLISLDAPKLHLFC